MYCKSGHMRLSPSWVFDLRGKGRHTILDASLASILSRQMSIWKTVINSPRRPSSESHALAIYIFIVSKSHYMIIN